MSDSKAIITVTDMIVINTEFKDTDDPVKIGNAITDLFLYSYNPLMEMKDKIKNKYLRGFYEIKVTFKQYQEVENANN